MGKVEQLEKDALAKKVDGAEAPDEANVGIQVGGEQAGDETHHTEGEALEAEGVALHGEAGGISGPGECRAGRERGAGEAAAGRCQ